MASQKVPNEHLRITRGFFSSSTSGDRGYVTTVPFVSGVVAYRRAFAGDAESVILF